jgi:hypothetical protein
MGSLIEEFGGSVWRDEAEEKEYAKAEQKESGESVWSDDKEREESIQKLQVGVEKLGEAGAKGITALRSLFERMKDKMKRKDVDRLENEIKELEDEKKLQLEKAGLLDQKIKLEKELEEIKKRKLESLI